MIIQFIRSQLPPPKSPSPKFGPVLPMACPTTPPTCLRGRGELFHDGGQSLHLLQGEATREDQLQTWDRWLSARQVVRQPCWYSTAYSSHLHDGVSNELRSLGCTSARRLEGMLRQTAPVFLLGDVEVAIRYPLLRYFHTNPVMKTWSWETKEGNSTNNSGKSTRHSMFSRCFMSEVPKRWPIIQIGPKKLTWNQWNPQTKAAVLHFGRLPCPHWQKHGMFE